MLLFYNAGAPDSLGSGYSDSQNELAAIPFESGRTSLFAGLAESRNGGANVRIALRRRVLGPGFGLTTRPTICNASLIDLMPRTVWLVSLLQWGNYPRFSR